MVLHADYPGAAYQQQSYTIYQEPDGFLSDGRYSNFSGMPMGHTAQYSSYPQMSSYTPGNAQHHQPGWSSGAGYHGNGASHYPRGGMVATGMPNTGGYGSSYHKQSHGYGDSYSHGNPTGYMGGVGSNMPEKMKHGINSYGHGNGNGHPNYNHSPGGMNHGYQRLSWTLKGLEDE